MIIIYIMPINNNNITHFKLEICNESMDILDTKTNSFRFDDVIRNLRDNTPSYRFEFLNMLFYAPDYDIKQVLNPFTYKSLYARLTYYDTTYCLENTNVFYIENDMCILV